MLKRVILQHMLGGEGNSYPIQLLVNYWEIRPSLIGARLDELLSRGISHIATFLPWQAVESDISHSLTRLLLAASDRKMTLSLILTPEVGVHYQYSGLPKDVISRTDNAAQHIGKSSVNVTLPPNHFSLPSLMAPEFTKRYYAFLSRMDNLLADFKRTHQRSLSTVNVVLTGSFWKYYRSARDSSRRPFAGVAGDFSNHASIEYRQKVEYYYSQPEFSDPTPAAANRWKTRQMEDVNRRWFNQQSEAVFRHRTYSMVRKKATTAGAREIELFSPEADPGLTYTHFLQAVSGGHGDFTRLSSMVDECAAFASQGAAQQASSVIHWSSLGSFRSLSDSEKQFLILKSLLMMGGLGGGILIDESEWFSLSQSFRSRAETFARSIAHGELTLRSRALYLTSHLWSNAAPLWNLLQERLGPEARMISSLDLLMRDRDATLVVVDPSVVLTREAIQKLSAWARGGRVVVLPRSPLYTEMSRMEIELLVARCKRMDIDLGVRYRLHELGDGKLIIHDVPQGISNVNEANTAWQTFLTAALSLADIHSYCKVSDARLSVIPLKRKGQSLGVFVLNATRRQISADIIFPNQVLVSDLAIAVSAATPPAAPVAQPGQAVRPPAPPMIPANRFSLDVPPCGVMPLQVSGAQLNLSQEKLEAALTAQAAREGARMAAVSELPGFDEASDFGMDTAPVAPPMEAGAPSPFGEDLWN